MEVEQFRPLATPPLPQLEPASPPRGKFTVNIYFVVLTKYTIKPAYSFLVRKAHC